MKNKFIMMLITTIITLFAAVAVANAADSGTCGENLKWSLDDEGVLTILGTGEMYDYTADNTPPWYYWRNDIKSIVINSGVTRIGNRAFNKCRVEEVYIPTSITSMGTLAFGNCSYLDAVYIQSLEKWCNIDFESGSANPLDGSRELYVYGNYSSTLVIPDGVTTIKQYAFYGYRDVKYLKLPNSVTTIEDSAFETCDHLQTVTLPDSVTLIGKKAFYKCESLYSINFPRDLEEIGANAFYGTKFTDITLPNKVKVIGNNAFSNCKALVSVVLPNGVKTIGNNAFSNCTALVSVVLPDSVTDLGERAFSNCTALKNVTVGNSVTEIKANTFMACTALESVKLPETLKSIGAYAFSGCSMLYNFTLPYNIETVAQSSFQNCYNIADVYYLGNESDFELITIETDNDYLLNATIHYNSVSTGKIEPMILFKSNNGEYELVPINIPQGSAIIVSFVRDDICVKCSVTSYTGQSSIPFELIDDFDTIEILAWNSTKGMMPEAKKASIIK